jgi:hypothetical protein
MRLRLLRCEQPFAGHWQSLPDDSQYSDNPRYLVPTSFRLRSASGLRPSRFVQVWLFTENHGLNADKNLKTVFSGSGEY